MRPLLRNNRTKIFELTYYFLVLGLLIDTVGRLPLLIASSVFMSMALAGFGSFAYYENVHRSKGYMIAQYDWIPLLCVLVFTIAFSMGISPISWLLIGELFPLEYRGLGSALATSFSYACAFIGVKTFVDFQVRPILILFLYAPTLSKLIFFKTFTLVFIHNWLLFSGNVRVTWGFLVLFSRLYRQPMLYCMLCTRN